MPIDLSNLSPEERRQFLEFLNRVGVQLDDIRDTYSQFSKEAQKHLEAVKKSYQVQSEMKKGMDGLIKGLKKIKDVQNEITALKKAALKAEGENKEIIEEEIRRLSILLKFYSEQYKAVNKTGVVFREMGKVIASFPKLLKAGFGELKGTGMFEMDKAIRTSALSMGLLGSRSTEFRNNIGSAQDAAIALGTTIQDLAEIQATYSDELGRAVLLSEKGLTNINDIAKGTGLGAEAAARMTAEFNAQGLSTQKTADFIEQTMNDASSMGLNSSKVIKNIQGNIKLLNRYNFKGGVKGLAKMAETVTKLGFDMESIAPLADKLFNIEGAVEMSAQLQVLGGRWSQLSDPFKLMYQARNDMDGLVKSIGEAAAQSASLDEDGNIKLASVEMARLRQVAETTGISYEQLAEAAKRAGKASIIKSKISMSGLDDKEQEFLANVSEFEDGKAFIYLDGKKKFLDKLDTSAKSLVKAKMDEQEKLKDRAEAAMSFDDQIKSITDQFKQYLLPMAKELADGFGKNLEKFKLWMKENKIGEKIQEAAKVIGGVINSFLGFVTNHPLLTLGAVGMAKVFNFLWEKGGWILNGIQLAKGFKMGMGGGGGGIMDTLPGGKSMRVGSKAIKAGKVGKGLGMITKGVGKAALPLALLDVGIDALSNATDNTLTIAEKFEKTLDQHKFMATGAAIGSIFPVIGTAVGAGIGGLIDMFAPEVGTYGNTKKVDDGVVFNPKDKFMKVNDGTMIAGTNENGNKSLAKALMTTMVPSVQPSSLPGSIKLSDLNITGRIELIMNGERSTNFGKELLSDPIFIRELSKKVNMAMANATSGTQNQNPRRN